MNLPQGSAAISLRRSSVGNRRMTRVRSPVPWDCLALKKRSLVKKKFQYDIAYQLEVNRNIIQAYVGGENATNNALFVDAVVLEWHLSL